MKRAQVAGWIAVLVSMAGMVRAEEFAAILDLKFIKDTGVVVGYLCLGDIDGTGDDHCSADATGYLFEATVRKKLGGKLPAQKFLVISGHHALPGKDRRGVVALVRKLEPAIEGAAFQIARVAVGSRVYCFDWFTPENDPSARPETGGLFQCFDPERDDGVPIASAGTSR